MEIQRKDIKNVSIGYFGSQSRFANEIINISIPDEPISRYIDITAGGLGTPFNIARLLIMPVTVNDISYYSYVCGKAIFSKELQFQFGEKDYDDLFKHLELQCGFLTEKDDETTINKRFGGWNENIRMFVDSVAEYAMANNDLLLQAALGKTLINEGSFRGLTWCGSSPEKIRLSEYPLEKFKAKLLRQIQYFVEMAKCVEVEGCEVRNLDASTFVSIYDKFEDSVVYIDCAWPWLPEAGDTTNPYSMVVFDIPSILQQHKVRLDEPLWNVNDTTQIWGNLNLWIKAPLTMKAKRVIISSQSTNFPPIQTVDKHLRDNFNVTNYINSKQFSGQAKSKKFEENWWVIENLKEVKKNGGNN